MRTASRSAPGIPSARGFLRRFLRDRSGATSIEYGLIISLIFLVILTSVTAFGNQASSIFNTAMLAVAGGMTGA